MKSKLSKEVDEYISQFPKSTQLKLQQLRACIIKVVPLAQEVISYKMPAYKQNSVLVYFAAYQNHIGFYPTGSGIRAFQKEIALYKNSKGAVQFALDKKLPVGLIQKMVRYRMREDAIKTKLKVKPKQTLKTCKNGHHFYKSSDCPVCPTCEKQKNLNSNFLTDLSRPAQRALADLGIKNIKQLSKYSEIDLLKLHGIGPASIPKLKKGAQYGWFEFYTLNLFLFIY